MIQKETVHDAKWCILYPVLKTPGPENLGLQANSLGHSAAGQDCSRELARNL